MKIAAIASNPEILTTIQGVLQDSSSSDQFIFLQRQNQDIRVDRIDLSSTNVLILDSEKISATDLRLISACTRENANPAVIYLTGPCSEQELLSAMRAGVTELIHTPIMGADLTAAIERIRSKKYISALHQTRGKIASFVSCKGGAGATFVAANLGYILAAEQNQKVLFIDLHLQFGDASFYLAEESGPTTLADIVTQAGLDSTVIATAAMQIRDNYYLLQAPDSAEDSLGIVASHIDNLLTIAVQDYDLVIVDLPLIVDALVMKALDRSDYIFTVMQSMVPYMRAVTKMSNLLNKLGVDRKKVKIVLNRVDPSIDISIAKMEDAIQAKIDFTITNEYAIVAKSVNIGRPVLLLEPENKICDNLRVLAGSLTGQAVKDMPSSFFKKIFSH
jgi:pilus assembly protein CpaE